MSVLSNSDNSDPSHSQPSMPNSNMNLSSNTEACGRCYSGESSSILYVVTLTIGCIGLPLTVAAIAALRSLIRKDNVGPVYIINLLITDVIQLCCMIIMGQKISDMTICEVFYYLHLISCSVNTCFIVVVALERYLMIVWPLWYKFKRNIKTTMIVSVVVWLFPLVYLPILVFAKECIETIIGCFLLLPFPLLVFFLGGTLRALSAARSVPPADKRCFVAVLVLVLLIYTLLFLPVVIFCLSLKNRPYKNYDSLTALPLFFSPLADLFLYNVMRKGVCDKLLAAVCCCNMGDGDVSTTVENSVTTSSGRPEEEEKKEGENKDGSE